MTSTQPPTQTSPATSATLVTPPSLQRIVLTGFMGAGKSTIGRTLADRLGWAFLDLDAHIEQRTGATVPQIFAEQGEARFRRLESTALASALTHRNTVIALGGGTPEAITNRLLAVEQTPGTFTVFLDAPFSTLYDRCVLQDATPSPSSPTTKQPRRVSLPGAPSIHVSPALQSTPHPSPRSRRSKR